MILNGKNTTVRTNNRRTFSFNVPTPSDGQYSAKLTFSKAGMATRVFEFEGVKGGAALPAAEQQPEAAEEAASAMEALSPSYTDLIAQAEAYDGKSLTFDGYVTGIEQEAGDYVLSLALRKAVTGYADTLLLVTPTDPGIPADSRVRVVGRLEGLSAGEGETPNLSYPRLRLDSIEQLAQADDQP